MSDHEATERKAALEKVSAGLRELRDEFGLGVTYSHEQWGEVSKKLTDTLLEGEQAVVIYLEAVAPTIDCELRTVTVGIRASVAGVSEEFTGNATDLDSACRIARWKLQERRKAVLKEREAAKQVSA